MSDPSPFTSFHRKRWWALLGTRAATLAATTTLVVGVIGLAAAAPGPSTAVLQPTVLAAPVNAAAVAVLPEPAPSSSNVPVEPPAPLQALPRTGTWAIDIDVTGYQAEIDACLWVRMDLRAAAPIVGAHNYCGGDIVLTMEVGDTVTLRGTSLDGQYEVSGSVDAWAGDSASAATEGLSADVILQTCYWQSNGRERLVALIRIT